MSTSSAHLVYYNVAMINEFNLRDVQVSVMTSFVNANTTFLGSLDLWRSIESPQITHAIVHSVNSILPSTTFYIKTTCTSTCRNIKTQHYTQHGIQCPSLAIKHDVYKLRNKLRFFKFQYIFWVKICFIFNFVRIIFNSLSKMSFLASKT